VKRWNARDWHIGKEWLQKMHTHTPERNWYTYTYQAKKLHLLATMEQVQGSSQGSQRAGWARGTRSTTRGSTELLSLDTCPLAWSSIMKQTRSPVVEG
jgi:hypothetical protein